MLLLCDVALGSQYERLQAEYEAADSAKANKCDSTWGVGKYAPDEGGARTIDAEVKVPMGQVGDSLHAMTIQLHAMTI